MFSGIHLVRLLPLLLLVTLSSASSTSISSAIVFDNDTFVAGLFPEDTFRVETPIAVRYAYILSIALYDVFAACHPTALSFFGTRDPIPRSLCEKENRAATQGFLMFRVIVDEYPEEAASVKVLLNSLGLDTDDMSTDQETPAGWANAHAKRILSYIETDGWNSVGDLTRRNFRQRFSDPTDYRPVNSAELPPSELRMPLRWQPLTQENDRRGRFTSQVHVTPHIGLLAKPLVVSKDELMNRTVPPPYKNPNRMGSVSKEDRATMNKLINELFEASRTLTKEQRIIANWWDSKLLSVGRFLNYYLRVLDIDLFDVYRIFLGEMIAQHDAMLIAWKEKRRHDLVRPPTVIRHLRKNRKTMAFISENEGVGTILEKEWEPVVKIQPHSEFPSASALLCTASFEHAQLAYSGLVGKEGTIPPYENMIPQFYVPNIKIDKPLPVRFETLQEAVESCAMSRLWAGVHFSPSISAAEKLGKGLGAIAFKHVSDLVAGKIPETCERCGKY